MAAERPGELPFPVFSLAGYLFLLAARRQRYLQRAAGFAAGSEISSTGSYLHIGAPGAGGQLGGAVAGSVA